MRPLLHVFHLSTGGSLEPEEQTPARRAQLTLVATVASLAMAASWGLAAGSAEASLAAANAYKLPLMLAIAAISAVPVGLLCWKIVGVRRPARELLHAYALSVFLGCAVLLVLSPLVALYYLSSHAGGPVIAIGTAFAALAAGCVTFVRVVRARLAAGEGGEEGRDWRPVVPGVVLAVAFVAALSQMIALFAPILPERTPFRGGIDDVLAVD